MMSEVYFDDVRSRYDAMVNKFNENFDKIFGSKQSLSALDTNGIAFLSAAKHTMYSLSCMDTTRKSLETIGAILWAKDQPLEEKTGLLEMVIKKLLSDPIAIE